MNEQVINKIAELMQVSYDEAVKLYPVLKTQFLWYEFLTNVSIVYGVMGCVLVPPTIMYIFEILEPNPAFKFNFNRAKYLLYTDVAILLCILLCFILKIVLAPDIVFIKGMLGGK